MLLLLDTHILLWWLNDDPALPRPARDLIANVENDIFVSSISLWEIAIKAGIGKIRANAEDVRHAIRASGFAPLSFSLDDAVEVAGLPAHHRDPFDRALIAQARARPLRLLTHDEVLAAYGDIVLLI